MKKNIVLLLCLTLLLFLTNCVSDSDSKQVEVPMEMTYLKNEWVATEKYITSNYLSALNKIELEDMYFRPMDDDLLLKIGVNKSDVLYFVYCLKQKESSDMFPIDVKFGCFQYSDSIFNGRFYEQAEVHGKKIEETNLKVLIMDDQTIVVVFAEKIDRAIEGLADHVFSCYKFKKTGPWDESTNMRSIFKNMGFSEELLDMNLGDNYEEARTGGKCF